MKDFLITLFLGEFGVHKFMRKKYGLGILYLCTFGLFGIGWMIDTFMAFIRLASGDTIPAKEEKKSFYKENSVSEDKRTKVYTQLQIEGMKKADILELALSLGYNMTTSESNTKEKIVADFMTQQEMRANTESMVVQKRWLIKTFNTEIVGTFADCDLEKGYTREEVICSFKPKSKLYLEHWKYKGEPAYYVCCQGVDAGCIPATLAKTLYEVYSDCEFEVTLRGESYYVGHNDLMQKIRVDIYK